MGGGGLFPWGGSPQTGVEGGRIAFFYLKGVGFLRGLYPPSLIPFLSPAMISVASTSKCILFSLDNLRLSWCIVFSEPPPKYSTTENELLQGCEISQDCPQGKSQCNQMLSPTSTGSSGYCVPSNCVNDADCPQLGDPCVTGVIVGTCQNNICDYDKFAAIATCVQQRKLFNASRCFINETSQNSGRHQVTSVLWSTLDS